MAGKWYAVRRADVEIASFDSRDDGSAVVLVHGLAGYGAEWRHTIEHLAERHRVISLDQRGHGRSTRRPRDLSRITFADDVAAVISAAGMTCPVTLIGQSMGAHRPHCRQALPRPDQPSRHGRGGCWRRCRRGTD